MNKDFRGLCFQQSILRTKTAADGRQIPVTTDDVWSTPLNVLTNNLHPYDSVFMWLQRKANIILHIWFYFILVVCW